jgi:hypothetical protein
MIRVVFWDILTRQYIPEDNSDDWMLFVMQEAKYLQFFAAVTTGPETFL